MRHVTTLRRTIKDLCDVAEASLVHGETDALAAYVQKARTIIQDIPERNHEMKTAKLGTIISGTLRHEDTIPAFAAELRALRGSLPRGLYGDVRAFNAGKLEAEDASDLANNLADDLQAYAPDYCYFGAHHGDGADFGFWLAEDWQQQAKDDGVLFVSDMSEVPETHKGMVCHVNDHGNATLYGRGGLLVVWSVV